MVDVSGKASTHRRAVAEAVIHMHRETLAMILDGRVPKGDALGVARVAGIMAAKKTGDLIPLCHSLSLTHASVDFEPVEDGVLVRAAVETDGPTGVEMEALTAAGVAALTLYDMCKAVDGHAAAQPRIRRFGQPEPEEDRAQDAREQRHPDL
jgi:cyclic pyranopterin phosphate synthase